jgi:uncharacterized protein
VFRLAIEAIARPTEDLEKVLFAIRNIVPESHPEVGTVDSVSIVRSDSQSVAELSRLHSLLRRERILDAARRSLFAGLSQRGLEFSLNKQAAFTGRISFCGSEDESPLGTIRFSIQCSDSAGLVDWLAPKTAHGKPLQELPMPSFNEQSRR